jgi:hypothetical protein
MSSYLEGYNFSPPAQDARQDEIDKQLALIGIPLHDFRAVDMVERALLHPKYAYRTAEGIEQEVFKLPIELVDAILRDTPSIARETPFKYKERTVYAHATKPKSAMEKAETTRRLLAEDIS